jgi:HEAT repeat protein
MRVARGADVGASGRAALEDAVVRALREDDDDGVRAAAVRALVRLMAAAALPRLIRAAGEDPAPEVRREAIAVLARLTVPPSQG